MTERLDPYINDLIQGFVLAVDRPITLPLNYYAGVFVAVGSFPGQVISLYSPHSTRE